MEPSTALAGLWEGIGRDRRDLGAVEITGRDPVLPSVFALGTAAGACVAGVTLAAGFFWQERGGSPPEVAVDLRGAAISFRSERHLRVGPRSARDQWSALSGDYRTGDGGWVRLHCNFPHHQEAVTTALAVAADRDALAGAVGERSAAEVEEAVVAAGGCAAAMRTRTEWMSHPQGEAVAGLPLVELTRVGECAPVPVRPADRPLAGLRVLDLTRVIAGPVCGRTLAAHGAEVLRVGAGHLPTIPLLVIDTGFGKRFCHIDLREEAGRDGLRGLLAEADVFVQAYRPGALARLGFGPEEVVRVRPGIVYVSLSAYGRFGPWRSRRGFDSLVQMASGIAHEGATAAGVDHPVPLPAQALDHGTGWLAALGALEGLRRRHREGGSWLVEVSLSRTARWIDGLGRVDGLGVAEPGQEDVADLLEESDSPFGPITYVRPPGRLAGSPPRWDTPPHLPGSDPPAWA